MGFLQLSTRRNIDMHKKVFMNWPVHRPQQSRAAAAVLVLILLIRFSPTIEAQQPETMPDVVHESSERSTIASDIVAALHTSLNDGKHAGQVVWDLPAGAPCSLDPVAEPAPRYCEPGMVRCSCAIWLPTNCIHAADRSVC
jgi:hypothetical protein